MNFIRLSNSKRFWPALLALITLAIYFWTQSRYPQLNQKALASDSMLISEIMTMFPLIDPSPWAPYWKKVAISVINWTYSNRQGMTFGLVFAALFRTVFTYLKWRPSRHPLLNTLLGMSIGAPLGVCVNCAAPVFRGVLVNQEKEMALSLMMSSPTLNYVVLSMTFALFPLDVAILKVLFTLTALFVVIPWACRTRKTVAMENLTPIQTSSAIYFNSTNNSGETWAQALLGVILDFIKYFFEIVIKTVPWMLLAAILGAFISNFFVLNTILKAPTSFLGLGLATFIGLFLPIPMAFDVVMVHALSLDGANPVTLMALLCSLGIFSFYSHMVVAKATSHKLALRLAGALFILTLVFCGITQGVESYKAILAQRSQVVLSESNDGVTCFYDQKACDDLNSMFVLIPPIFSLPMPDKELFRQIADFAISQNGNYQLHHGQIAANGEDDIDDKIFLELDGKMVENLLLKFNAKHLRQVKTIKMDIFFKSGKGHHQHIFQRYRGVEIRLPGMSSLDKIIISTEQEKLVFIGPFDLASYYLIGEHHLPAKL